MLSTNKILFSIDLDLELISVPNLLSKARGGLDKITCDSKLLSRHRFSKLVYIEDWSSSGQLNVVYFAFVLYALVINKNQLSYELLYPTFRLHHQ